MQLDNHSPILLLYADDAERRSIAAIFVSQLKPEECKQLALTPPLTEWRYRYARQHLIVWGAGRRAPPIKIYRQRIPATGIEEALDFIYHPNNLQQVAFGTKNLTISATGKTVQVEQIQPSIFFLL